MASVAHDRLNEELGRAAEAIFSRRLGAAAEIKVDGEILGWGKVKSKWCLYYLFEGERTAISQASMKTRALLAHNLMELWGEIQIASKQLNAWVIEAADAASEFSDYIDELAE